MCVCGGGVFCVFCQVLRDVVCVRWCGGEVVVVVVAGRCVNVCVVCVVWVCVFCLVCVCVLVCVWGFCPVLPDGVCV